MESLRCHRSQKRATSNLGKCREVLGSLLFAGNDGAEALDRSSIPLHRKTALKPAGRETIMVARTLVTSPRWRNASCLLAAALFVTVSFGMRTVSAEECGPHCDPRTHPSQYSDPRCESRRSGPRLERDELRCDTRVQPRRVDHHAPPATPPSQASSTGQMPAIGSVDSQQSRPAERDVGFDDAFVTQGNAQQAGGANPGSAPGANPGGAAGANPGLGGAAADAHRAPPSRR
jgi:hypothetical protein